MKTLELHLHLEGSVSPKRLRTLAERHGRPEVPRLCLGDDGRYRATTDFSDFLEVFKAVKAVLQTPADYHATALDLGAALAAQDVVYAEVTIGYGVMHRHETDPLPVQAALAEAADEVAAAHGVVMRWLPDAVRQWGADAAWRVVEAACKAGPEAGVVGFGLGGEELAAPASTYAEHFAAARSEGLGTTLHAGEAGDPEAVRDALSLGVMRIGHGTAAGLDPQLISMLALSGTFVELCPGSNVATGAVASLADHPLRTFLDAGIPCCLNTDDPELFGLTLRNEYAAATEIHGLTESEADIMRWQALAAAFMPEPLRKEIGARLAPDADQMSDLLV